VKGFARPGRKVEESEERIDSWKLVSPESLAGSQALEIDAGVKEGLDIWARPRSLYCTAVPLQAKITVL
jgi:hypothetical protein